MKFPSILVFFFILLFSSCQKEDIRDEVLGDYWVTETKTYIHPYSKDTITNNHAYLMRITKQDYDRVALLKFSNDITFFAKVSTKLIVPSRHQLIVIKREGADLVFNYSYSSDLQYTGTGRAIKQ